MGKEQVAKIKIPRVFSFLEDPAGAMQILEHIRSIAGRKNVRHIDIDHSDCETLGLCASAAEGEFFREAFSKACEGLDLSVAGLRERDLEECVQTTFGKAATRMWQQISTLGHSLGPPWTKDQKMAAPAALVVLANKQT